MNNIAFDAGDCTGSTAARLLSRLSVFSMFHLLLHEHREIALRLGTYYRDVQTTFSAIQVLLTFRTSQRGSGFCSELDSVPSRRECDNTTALFADLGVPSPMNENEAEFALAKVLEHQRYLLNVSEPL